MMYDQVLSKPDGGDLQDRVENYFLAWSNSVRMDLEALGVLDSHGSTDALFSIDPVAMTDEQLDAAMALMERKAVLGERRGGAAGRDRDYPDGGAGLALRRNSVTQFNYPIAGGLGRAGMGIYPICPPPSADSLRIQVSSSMRSAATNSRGWSSMTWCLASGTSTTGARGPIREDM